MTYFTIGFGLLLLVVVLLLLAWGGRRAPGGIVLPQAQTEIGRASCRERVSLQV